MARHLVLTPEHRIAAGASAKPIVRDDSDIAGITISDSSDLRDYSELIAAYRRRWRWRLSGWELKGGAAAGYCHPHTAGYPEWNDTARDYASFVGCPCEEVTCDITSNPDGSLYEVYYPTDPGSLIIYGNHSVEQLGVASPEANYTLGKRSIACWGLNWSDTSDHFGSTAIGISEGELQGPGSVDSYDGCLPPWWGCRNGWQYVVDDDTIIAGWDNLYGGVFSEPFPGVDITFDHYMYNFGAPWDVLILANLHYSYPVALTTLLGPHCDIPVVTCYPTAGNPQWTYCLSGAATLDIW